MILLKDQRRVCDLFLKDHEIRAVILFDLLQNREKITTVCDQTAYL